MKILEEDYIYSEEDVLKFKDSEAIYINSDIEFKVDLSMFANLKQLRLQCKKYENLSSLATLEYLNIYPLSKNRISEISELTNLIRLDITKGDFENLDFLLGLVKLEYLELSYLPKLIDVSSLSKLSNTLKSLEIVSCKKIQLLSTLNELKELEALSLSNFKLADIMFVDGLPKLKSLLIVNSNILSGDISPAKDIEYVGIDNKRHYNYRFDDSTMRIVPRKTTKTALKKPQMNNIIDLSNFGKIDLKSLDDSYEGVFKDETYSIHVDLNFTTKEISKKKIKIVSQILNFTPSNLNLEIRGALKQLQTNESLKLYHEFISEEFNEITKNIELFIDSLSISRIGFYPESEDDAIILDLSPLELDLDHVLCIHMNSKTLIVDISVES